MSDILNENGLQLKNLTTLVSELNTALQNIYGADINLDPNSPDGQLVNTVAQEGVDLREVLNQVNANFDPDQASGRVLDQRVAINGIERNGGTYTFTPVSITTDRALNLVGLDTQVNELTPTVSNLYTVQDDAGNQFYLVSSISIVAPGSQSLSFRAAALGEVNVQLNTITNPVTNIAGVTGINNPSAPTIIGRNEESDAALRIRRQSSVAVPAIGFLDSLEASLSDLEGVTTAIVFENQTDTTDSNGIPPHSIWVVVEGGDVDSIGLTIYTKKSSGSGMRGTQTVNVPRPDGRIFVSRFDRPVNQDLWIRFSLSLPGGGVIDTDNVKEQIVEGLFWDINGEAGADDVIDFVKGLNPDYRVTGAEVSTDNITYSEVVNVSSPQNRFVNDVTRITIA